MEKFNNSAYCITHVSATRASAEDRLMYRPNVLTNSQSGTYFNDFGSTVFRNMSIFLCSYTISHIAQTTEHNVSGSAVRIVFFSFQMEQLSYYLKFRTESNSYHRSQKSPVLSTC